MPSAALLRDYSRFPGTDPVCGNPMCMHDVMSRTCDVLTLVYVCTQFSPGKNHIRNCVDCVDSGLFDNSVCLNMDGVESAGG